MKLSDLQPKIKYILLGVATVGGICIGGHLMTRSQEEKPTIKKEDKPPKVTHPPKSVPKPQVGSIAANNNTEFTGSSAGKQFENYLLDTNGSSDKWSEKKTKLNAATLSSGLFKTAKRQNGDAQLKTSCKQMYTITQDQWTKTNTGGTNTEQDRSNLWKETWIYCSVTGEEKDRPDNWPYKNGVPQ